jgi:DNA-binding transcriptional MerR regulator
MGEERLSDAADAGSDSDSDSESAGSDNAGDYSIDELARLSGSNVRNVRLYQERGLLPPPRREGRANRYTDEHLERLRLILGLLGKGYPLAAIRELLEAWAGQRSLGDVLGFEEVVSAPFVTEAPRRYSSEEILQMFPDEEQPERSWSRAVELGLLVPEGDGFLAPSPLLVEAGAELVADGVPVAVVLDLAGVVQRATDRIASVFVAMFLDHVWQPFVDAGMPPDRLPDITEALERQRPLAQAAVTAALAQAMQRRVESAVRKEAPELLRGRGAGRSAGRPSGRRRHRRHR